MKTYAKVDESGILQYTVFSPIVQTGLVELDFVIPESPDSGYLFNINTKTWQLDPDITKRQQIEWVKIRAHRNNLLAETDWTQLPDVPLTTKTAWATYRQELRDITTQADPFNINWPVPPNA